MALEADGCPWTPAWGADVLLETEGFRKVVSEGCFVVRDSNRRSRNHLSHMLHCPEVWVSSVSLVVSQPRTEAYVSNTIIYTYLNPLLIFFLPQDYP